MTENTVRPAETAEQFVRKARRATRWKFGSEEKIRIILEGLKGEVFTADLRRHERIPPRIYYSWLKDFMEGGKSRRSRGRTRS